MSEEQKKPMFGITEETKDSNVVVISTAKKVEGDAMFPNNWKFPIARLVNVISNPALEKKNGDTTAVLQFIFKTPEKEQFTHTEWEVDTTDAKFTDKVEYMNIRIKHIYTTIFGTFPKEGIGAKASNFVEFFNAVKEAFDSVTIERPSKADTDKTVKIRVYTTVSLFIKVTYYKTNLKFPLAPNFLEKVIEGKPCKILTINTAYDDLEPTKKSNPAMGGIGGSADLEGELPDFDTDFN